MKSETELTEAKEKAELLNVAFHMHIRKLERAIRKVQDAWGAEYRIDLMNDLFKMLPENQTPPVAPLAREDSEA